jgi:hypothetical protein
MKASNSWGPSLFGVSATLCLRWGLGQPVAQGRHPIEVAYVARKEGIE